MRHNSRARTRGGNRPASFWRSMSHSGCGRLPTSVVGKSLRLLSLMAPTPLRGAVPRRPLAAGQCRLSFTAARIAAPC